EPRLLPGILRPAHAFRARVDRLLDPVRDRSPRLARVTSLASAGALIGAVTVSSWLDPIIVFLEAPVPTPRAAAITTIPHRHWTIAPVALAAAPTAAATRPRRTQRPSDIPDQTTVAPPMREAIADSRTPVAAPDVEGTHLPMPLVNRAVVERFSAPLPSTRL